MNKIMTTEAARHGLFRYLMCALVLSLLVGANIDNAKADKTAIGGYDPVAYFEMLEAVKGVESISYKWLGEEWRFANEEHKALFSTDPMRYMPTFGGYCSYDETLSEFRNHRHRVNPTAWRIVDGKLYLFSSEKTANHAVPTEKWDKVKEGLSQ
ncbi:MAG: hypothetical protein KJN95_11940 [Gammaproteobacteria bacterium]|nr:hypothetical protein [Gammaproteobacteria bacterium]